MDQSDILGEFKGTTTRFTGNGRKLGYPTANIDTNAKLPDGIYFGYADLADYTNNPAMIFIGAPITLNDSHRRLEAYLLDIDDKDYYDQELVARVEHFHRKNQKFNSLQELKDMMNKDELAARKWFEG